VCHTTPLTTRCCILNIQQISTEYFKHAAESPFFPPLLNVIYFIICLVPVFLNTGVLKLKRKLWRQRVNLVCSALYACRKSYSVSYLCVLCFLSLVQAGSGNSNISDMRVILMLGGCVLNIIMQPSANFFLEPDLLDFIAGYSWFNNISSYQALFGRWQKMSTAHS
jgi:hypothetical protein